MESAETVRRILGCLPEPDHEALDRVRRHVKEHRLLVLGECCVAAVDESWLDNGERGVLLTDRRVLRYRGDRASDVAAFSNIERVRVRRIWYPAPPFLRRGEGLGAGPVVILRFLFLLRGAPTRARLRLQDHAGGLRPFVEALLGRVQRIEVARTLPGL